MADLEGRTRSLSYDTILNSYGFDVWLFPISIIIINIIFKFKFNFYPQRAKVCNNFHFILLQVRIDSSPTSSKEPLVVVFSDDPSKHRRFENQQETNNLIAEEEKLIAQESEVFSSTKRRRKRSVSHEKKMNVRLDGIKIGVKRRTDHTQRAKTREKRSPHVPDSCHREEMEINFSRIGYHHIHTPTEYQAYKCVGHCHFPITTDTTRHAIFHATMHFRRAVEDPPCCVPTKLGPISMLIYYEDVVEFVYEYHEMIVEECGCRWKTSE